MDDKKQIILVVDDEPDIRNMISDELTYEGYHCLKAESGNEALKIFTQTPSIDAIVTDIRMSNGGGDELLKTIKNIYHSHVPIFLITGFSDLTVREALHLGAAGFFHKPFKYDELFDHIKKSIGPIELKWEIITDNDNSSLIELDSEILLKSNLNNL